MNHFYPDVFISVQTVGNFTRVAWTVFDLGTSISNCPEMLKSSDNLHYSRTTPEKTWCTFNTNMTFENWYTCYISASFVHFFFCPQIADFWSNSTNLLITKPINILMNQCTNFLSFNNCRDSDILGRRHGWMFLDQEPDILFLNRKAAIFPTPPKPVHT